MANPISIPVIARELRVQARKKSTYYSRALWGLAAGAFLAYLFASNPRLVTRGHEMFSLLHGAFVFMLFLSSPLAAADSISRERRDGTLGLLLLTSLTPWQVALSKFLSHSLRVFFLAMMMVPFLMMPILIGGVTMRDFLISVGILFSISLLGLSAGFIASAISREFGAALVRSLIFALLLNWAASTLVTNTPFFLLQNTASRYVPEAFLRLIVLGPAYLIVPSGIQEFFQRSFAIRHLYEMMTSGLVVTSIISLMISLKLSAWQIARISESSAQSRRKEIIHRRFLSPVIFKKRFRKSMGRRLDRNPFGWLETRTPTARAGRWIAILALLAVELALVLQNGVNFHGTFNFQIPLLWILAFTIAIKSAASFQSEKENGAFELILVTAIKEPALVWGRLRAVIGYFFPICLLLAAACALGWLNRGSSREYLYTLDNTVRFLNLWLSLLTVPAAGLYFALRFKTYLPALCWTLFFGIYSATIVWGCFEGVIWSARNPYFFQWGAVIHESFETTWWPPLLGVGIYHLILVRLFTHLSSRLLKQRTFATAKTS